jgi:hypothetical protein
VTSGCARGRSRSQTCGNASVYCPPPGVSRIVVPPGWYSTPLEAPEDQRYSVAPCDGGYYCSEGRRVSAAETRVHLCVCTRHHACV